MKLRVALLAMQVVVLGSLPAFGQIAYSVRSDVDDILYSINLATGVATPIGPVGFGDVEAVSFHPLTGVLYGVDDSTNQLVTINLTTGAGTVVGPLGVAITDMGLSFDCAGNLYMSVDAPQNFYRINPATGAATLIGAQEQQVTGLAFHCGEGVLYGMGGDNTNNLVRMNTSTGAATPIGPLGLDLSDGGIDFDPSTGVLWGLRDSSTSNLFIIHPHTGAATVVATTTIGGVPAAGFEGLAIRHAPLHTVHLHRPQHVHHGRHGHSVGFTGQPPHVPGHSLAATAAADDAEVIFVGGVNEDGTLNGVAGDSNAARPSRRGSELQLFGGVMLSRGVLPDVWIGDARAIVTFSGPAPSLTGAWQLNVRVPEEAPSGSHVPVRIQLNGVAIGSAPVTIE